MIKYEPNPKDQVNSALAYFHAGEFARAENLSRQVLHAHPAYLDALHILGFSQLAQHRLDEAIDSFRRALILRFASPEIHTYLGLALAAQGNFEEAVVAYQHALEVVPDYADALLNLGVALASLGRLDESIGAYRRALEIHPDHPSAYNNLAAALCAASRFEEGIAAYRQAIRLNPKYADAWNNLGVAFWNAKREEEALDAYQSAIRCDPHHATAYNNIGNYFLTNFRNGEAIDALRSAIRIRPDFVEALGNLGLALMEDGAYDEAAGIYDRALKLSPDEIEVRWGFALFSLLRGNFRRGWLEYEWRWRTKARSALRINYPKPTWCGEELNGQRILIYTEQGFGDCIQFVRYATLVAKRGGRVILLCLPELTKLMKGVAGIEEIVSLQDSPEFDCYCPLMTLPLVFSTQLETIPADVPYLKADPGLVEIWRQKIDASANALKVGLVWAGGAGYRNDRKRSLTLARLAPLAQIPGVVFYSLQKGEAASQSANPPMGLTLIDLTGDITDFSETAALISHLDLVISVDTSVAHLAGALGKPVWLMLPANPDWRWLLNRDDSPWYPTMRLFRQTNRGQWEDVIERVAQALAGLQDDSISAKTLPADDSSPRKLTTADAIVLAWQHHLAGEYSKAAAIYRQIISQQPNNADALHLMGLSAMGALRADMAVEWFGRAVAVNLAIPDYQNNLALALAATGKFEQAISAYQNVIRLKPDFPDAYYNMGNALLKSKRYDEAIDAYRQAIKARPDHSDAHLNLGQALAHKSRHAESIESFREAIRLNPSHAPAHMNLALALMELGQLDAADAVTRQSITLDSNSAESHWLLAALCLLRGDFEQGWKEYEWRWSRLDAPTPPRQFSQPRWDGGDLTGRTILLHAEQGLGDTIQFVRYAPLVARRGGRVIVQCPANLARLRTVQGIAEIIPPSETIPFDVQCPLLSLPLALGTRLDSIPAHVPYVHVDAVDGQRWNALVGAAESAHFAVTSESTNARSKTDPRSVRRIGLVWAGAPNFKDDHKRSITLAHLAPLRNIPNTVFYSLQKGPASLQIADPSHGLKLIDLTPELKDFADTAALISQLDLVISVDTAVAHLAGALGKPVWVMLPFSPDWRWMLERSDSPWYPTMRLFRQKTGGDWDNVIEHVLHTLRIYILPD